MRFTLEFERPVVDLKVKIAELKKMSGKGPAYLKEEISFLERKLKNITKEVYAHLSPWQKVQLSRHSDRPQTLDYIEMIFKDFIELHGDRLYRDDPAIIGGIVKLEDKKIVLIGQQKGRDTKQKIYRNFGMSHPEGYRKAKRLMRLAEQFNLPVVTFIDTPGAYPGIGAEERGQSEAIASNLLTMVSLKTPILSIVIGEGGSGGALAIGIADRVLMMEFAIYSVISPEGCASILWSDSTKNVKAAEALKITAKEIYQMGIIDGVIREPAGGAHQSPRRAAVYLKQAIIKELEELKKISLKDLINLRYKKYRKMGVFDS